MSSVVQSWRSWWSGGKDEEEDKPKDDQENSERKKDQEESADQAIPPAWVKGFGGMCDVIMLCVYYERLCRSVLAVILPDQ